AAFESTSPRRLENMQSCFFFSSRRRHTRSKRDWSSDVCSSDLVAANEPTSLTTLGITNDRVYRYTQTMHDEHPEFQGLMSSGNRSEERRVGKECRTRRETQP